MTTALATGRKQELTRHDVERIGRLLEQSIAPNTAKAYRRALDQFRQWAAGREATDAVIAAYVAHLADQGKAPATIKQAVAALGAAARAGGVDDPRKSLTRQALKGAVRQNRAVGRGQAKGLTRECAIAAATAASADGTVKGARDAAMLRIASDCLLRVSELRAITPADIRREEDGSGRLTIHRSKSDQEGEGAVSYVTPETMRVLERWVELAGLSWESSGPLLRRVTRSGAITGTDAISPVAIRNVFRQRAAAVGVEGCSTHSARVGSAQSLVERGASTAAVANAGRWSDPGMVIRYSRAQAAGRGAVAQYFGGK